MQPVQYVWPPTTDSGHSVCLTPWADGLLLPRIQNPNAFNFAIGVTGLTAEAITVVSGTVMGFVDAVSGTNGAAWLLGFYGDVSYAPGESGQIAYPIPNSASGDVFAGAAFCNGYPYFVAGNGDLFTVSGGIVVSVTPGFGHAVCDMVTNGIDLYAVLPASANLATYSFSSQVSGSVSGEAIPIGVPGFACDLVSGKVLVGGWTDSSIVSGATSFAMNEAATLVAAVNTPSNAILTISGVEPDWAISASVSGTGAPVDCLWAASGEQVLVSDTTNSKVQVFNLQEGVLVAGQVLTGVSGVAGLAVTPDGNTVFCCQPAHGDITVLTNTLNEWSINQTVSGFTEPTSVLTLSNESAVFGSSGVVSFAGSSDNSWSVTSTVSGLGFIPSSLTVDGNGNIYAAGGTGTGYLAVITTIGISATTSWSGNANAVYYEQAQIAVLDSANSVIRVFSFIGSSLRLQNTISLTEPCSSFGYTDPSVWLCGASGIYQYLFTAPFTLAPQRAGAISIYNGSSWSTSQLEVGHQPTAAAQDVSGNVWVATLQNDLKEFNSSATLLNSYVLQPSEETAGGVYPSLGISALVWWGGVLYAASSQNEALLAVSGVIPTTITAPSIPTGLSISAITADTVTVSWNAPFTGTQPLYYQVQYEASTGTWQNFDGLITSTSETVSGLSDGASYQFQVIASNSAGSITSAPISATTTATPTLPTNLTASNISTTSLTLSWAASFGAPVISYIVQYMVVGGASWTALPAVSGTTVNLTGLLSGTNYEIEVIASNGSGSATSNPISVLTSSGAVAPSAPTGLTASSITTTGLILSWIASNGSAPITYQPQYMLSGGTVWTGAAYTTATSASLTGLAESDTYEFRIVATNSVGSTDSADPSTIQATLASGSAPALTMASIAQQMVGTAFVVSGTIVGYGSAPVLQYQDGSGSWLSLPSGASVSATAFNFTNPGISPATTSTTVSVRDSNDTAVSGTSNSFAVVLLTVTSIPYAVVSTAFGVSGTVSGYAAPPTLQYEDTGGSWTSLPGGSTVSTTAFSFINPAIGSTTSSMAVSVRDANDTSITASSNSFSVLSSAPSKSLTVAPIGAQTVGVPFTVSGTVSGYGSAPTLEYEDSTGGVSGSGVEYVVLSVSGAGTWTVPSNFGSLVSVEGIGGGGGAANGGGVSQGGNGGSYAKITSLSLTPGQEVSYYVGPGGTGGAASSSGNVNGTAGTATWFGSTSTLLAAGGNGGIGTETNPVGNASSTGSLLYAGGLGGTASIYNANPYGGTGGGGAGGPHGAGGAGGAINSGAEYDGGSGGGGSGGGTAGIVNSNTSGYGSNGGNNYSGSGYGAGATSDAGTGGAGTDGGGGGGGSAPSSGDYTNPPGGGGAGGAGIDMAGGSAGSGGGGGGAADGPSTTVSGLAGGSGGLYGGGGGAGSGNAYGAWGTAGGNGAKGVIVVTYNTSVSGWLPLPSGAVVTDTGFTFTNPAINTAAVSGVTVSVRDENSTSVTATSNGFAVNPSITIATITEQTEGVSFSVTGALAGYNAAPTLQYQDSNGAWTSLPGGATVSATTFSFINPAINTTTSTMTVSVRDANNTVVVGSSNSFVVASAASSVSATVTGFQSSGTNLSTNPSFTGGVNGTTTLPTNFYNNHTDPGITCTLIDTGTVSGVAYCDLRFNGTTQTARFELFIDDITTTAAESALGLLVGLSGGSDTNISVFSMGANYGAPSGYLGQWTDYPLAPLPSASLVTVSYCGANGSGTESIEPGIFLTYSVGVPIDITLRLAGTEFVDPSPIQTPVVFGPKAFTVGAGGLQVAITWLSVSDSVNQPVVDSGNSTLTLACTSGTLRITNPVGTVTGQGTNSLSVVSTIANILTSLNTVVYTSGASYGSDTVVVTYENQASDTASITINGTIGIASGLPGAPTAFSVLGTTNGTVTVGFAPPITGGVIDAGGYTIYYEAAGGSGYVSGATVPVVTPGAGSFLDPSGASWAVTPGGQVSRNGGPDTSTSNVVLLLMANKSIIWQLDSAGEWYSEPYGAPGTWSGATVISPLESPGVTLSGLTTGTTYNLEVAAINTTGTGPVAGPIVATAGAVSIAIAGINQQTVGTAFPISGSLSGYSSAPTLQYEDSITNTWTALPGGSSVSATSFSFLHPGLSTAESSMTVSVRDEGDTVVTATSNSFAVVASSGTGPVAAGSLVTVNFQSNFGQTVVPGAYGWSTGGMGNDGSYLNSHGASGLPTGNFAFFADPTLVAAAGALNPRLIRFNGNLFASNGYGSGSDSGDIFNSNGTINKAAFANLVTNFYKVNPTNDGSVIIGFNVPGDVVTSTTICQQCFAALGTYLSTATMGNGQPFPSATGKIYFEAYNEPDGVIAQATDISYYNAMYAGIKSVGSSKLLCAAPTTSWFPGNGYSASTMFGSGGFTGVDLIDYHGYPTGSNTVGTASWALAANLASTVGSGRSEINAVTSAYANTPIFLGEYSINGNPPGDPAMQTYVGAVFDALTIVEALNQANVGTFMSGQWDAFADGNYYLIGYTGIPSPAAYFLSAAAATCVGTRVTSSGSSNVTILATKPTSNSIAVMVINSSGSTQTGSIGLSQWPINSSGNGTLNMWQLNSSTAGPLFSVSGVSPNATLLPNESYNTAVTITDGIIPNTSYPNGSITIYWNALGTSTGLPGDPTGTSAYRIADLMEIVGVDCFPNGQDGEGTSGSAWAQASAYAAGFNWIVSGSGMGMFNRIYANTTTLDEGFVSGVCLLVPNTAFTSCVSYASGTVAIVEAEAASWLVVSGYLKAVEGYNEPNNASVQEGDVTVPVATCLTAQQGIWGAASGGVKVMLPSVYDTGSNTYETDYMGSNLAAFVAAGNWCNGHDYPNSGAPNNDMARRSDYLATTTGLPVAITEFNPILYNNVGNNTTLAAFFAEIALLSGYVDHHLNALIWFCMYDYTGFSPAVGMFSGTTPFNTNTPSTTAIGLRAMYQLTGEPNSSVRHTFGTSRLNYSITGLPSAAAFSPLSGGRSALFQNSVGTFFLYVWNEQNTYGGTAVPVKITFNNVAMESVTEYVVSNTTSESAPMTVVQTVNNASSITIQLAAEVHLLVIEYP